MPADLEGRLAGLRAFDYLPGLPDPADLRHTAERRRRRDRMLAAGLLAVAAVAAVVAIVVAPHRASPKPIGPPPVPGRPVLVTGRLTLDGQPAPFGVVTARVWPNSAFHSALPAGAHVPTFDFSAPVDATTGRYRLTLDPSVISPNYWEDGHVLNVEFDVRAGLTGSVSATWNEPITLCGAKWCNDAGGPPTLDFNLGRNPTVTQDGASPLPLPT